MSTLTVYADVSDGYLDSSDATYSNARAGTGSGLTANTAGTLASSGQSGPGTFHVYQAFFGWDTSPLGAGVTVSVATCSLWLGADSSSTDFVANARLDDWGTTLTTADFVAGASFPGAFTLLAHIDTNGIGATGAYKALVDDAFAANVNKTGFTRAIVVSSLQEAGTQPGASGYVSWSSADNAGTTNDPKLDLTYATTAAGKAQNVVMI